MNIAGSLCTHTEEDDENDASAQVAAAISTLCCPIALGKCS
jgi:hypothetical protein